MSRAHDPGGVVMNPGVLALASAGFKFLYPKEEAARLLGVSVITLDGWRKDGLISPRKAHIGASRADWYTLPDLLAFVNEMPRG